MYNRKMNISELYEGHYRALEKEFLELILKLSSSGEKITAIAAGAGQLNELRKLILSNSDKRVFAGIDFLPGIQYLARKISSFPINPEKVSHADRTIFAFRAMQDIKENKPLYHLRSNIETTHSMGSFLEMLLEQGVTPEIYEAITLSLGAGPSETEEVIGQVFKKYDDLRERVYHQCDDLYMKQDTTETLSGVFVFYGFYDLNPGQRRFLEAFAKRTSKMYWFSPLSDNSPWADIYSRTKKLLNKTGSRCDTHIEMNSFGQFFESLLSNKNNSKNKKITVPAEFRITASSGEMGACRDTLSRITELHAEGVPYSKIAVVRRKQGYGSLVRMAHHEGIPVKDNLKAKVSELPEVNLLLLLTSLESGQFHYLLLQEILSTGLLKSEMAYPASNISTIVLECGVRFNRNEWKKWYSTADPDNKLRQLLQKLDEFYGTLPKKAHPIDYLNRLRKLFERLYCFEISGDLEDLLFRKEVWLAEAKIDWSQFSSMMQIQLREQDVELSSGDPDGFSVLTIEKVRGSKFDSVIIMDLEEGIYPKPVVEDPRLTEDLRTHLQMSRKLEREIEDGFLIRQAAEAAQKTLDIIYRQRDVKGTEIYPSSFIYELVSKRENWFKVSSSSPYTQLLGGSHKLHETVDLIKDNKTPDSPFFTRGCNASGSRMDFSADFDEYDGILEENVYHHSTYSATMLEEYIKCPFAFLAGRIWRLKKKELAGISTTPTPMKKGIFVHDAVEEIVEKYNFAANRKQIKEILVIAAEKENIAKKIGSETLKDVFIEEQESIIFETLQQHKDKSWKFFRKEERLTGKIGDIDIEGRIDLILENDKSELIIIDLKTGRLPENKSTEEGNEFQLPFYYQLVTQSYPGKKIEGVCYMAVSAREPGNLEGFTADEMQEILDAGFEESISEIIELLNGGIFPPLPRNTKNHPCTYCDFRALCRRTPYERLKSKAEVSTVARLLAEEINNKDEKW